MVSKIKLFLNNDFVRHVGILSGGNVFAQLILLFSAPIITRIFTPSDFGLFALYFSLVSIFSKIGTLCYERAIVLPKQKNDSVSVIVTSLIINLIIVGLLVLCIVLFGKELAALLDAQDLEIWLYLIPLSVFLETTQNIFRLWLIRQETILWISFSKISNAFLSSITKVSLGLLLGSWIGGLIVGSLVGAMIGLIMLLYKTDIRELLNLSRFMTKVSVFRIAIRYKSFPIFASPSAILNTISEQMAVFLFSAFFGPAIVGFYALSGRLLKQPVVVFAASVGSVYTRKAAKLVANNKRVMPGLIKTQVILFTIGFIPFLLLGLYGDIIVSFVFGDQWGDAGRYAKIMSPWFYLLFLAAPTTAIYEVLLKQHLRLLINIITWILRVISLIGGYYFTRDVINVLVYFVFVNVLMELLTVLISYRIVYQHDTKISLLKER